MGICTDPIVGYFKDLGYNFIKYPKENLRPWALYEKLDSSSLSQIGSVQDLFDISGGIKRPGKPQNRPDISHKQTAKIGVEAAFTILGDLLQAMGGGQFHLGAVFEKAGYLQFSFEEVQSYIVYPTDIDTFLQKAPYKPSSYIDKMKKGKIYVCSEVLVSPKFRVQVFTKSGQELEIKSYVK